jgi:hypothetical protein
VAAVRGIGSEGDVRARRPRSRARRRSRRGHVTPSTTPAEDEVAGPRSSTDTGQWSCLGQQTTTPTNTRAYTSLKASRSSRLSFEAGHVDAICRSCATFWRCRTISRLPLQLPEGTATEASRAPIPCASPSASLAPCGPYRARRSPQFAVSEARGATQIGAVDGGASAASAPSRRTLGLVNPGLAVIGLDIVHRAAC